MASPLGHSLLGLAIGRAAGSDWSASGGDASDERRVRLALVVTAMGAALAPDLDFIPGLFVGDPNQFHQLYSHSLGAVIAFGLAGAGLVRWRWPELSARRFAAAMTIGYGSHLVMDFFTHDPRAPFGIPLLWPFVTEHFTSPVPVFRGILHGVPGDPPVVIIENVLSIPNLIAVGIEVAAVAPVILAAELLRRTA